MAPIDPRILNAMILDAENHMHTLDEVVGEMNEGGKDRLLDSDGDLPKRFHSECVYLLEFATDTSIRSNGVVLPNEENFRLFMTANFNQLCGLMASCLKNLEDKMSPDKSEFEQFLYPYGYVLHGLKNLLHIQEFPRDEAAREFNSLIMTYSFAVSILYAHIPVWIIDETHWENLLNPSSYPYEQKVLLIRSLFPKDDPQVTTTVAVIDKSNLLEESFQKIYKKAQSYSKRLSIRFTGEVAMGFGVVREWFEMISRHLFGAELGVFKACGPNNRLSPIAETDQQLKYLRFAAAVIGLAVKYNIPLGILFDRVFFMTLAGKDINIEDIKETDNELYDGYKKTLSMSADDIAELELEYVEGDREVKVTSTNIHSFIQQKIERGFLLNNLNHFLNPFSLPFKNIKGGEFGIACVKFFRLLDLEDLDKLLGGEATIDAEDWEAHTVLEGYGREDPQIQWFWKIVGDMTSEQKSELLFFWTSMRRLPFEGFGGLENRPKLVKWNAGSDAHFPSSRTCFPLLHMPPYSTFKLMEERLKLIVSGDLPEGSFGYN